MLDESAALHDLARLGRADDVADRLQALAAIGQGDFLRVLADHAGGLARGDPDGLGDAAERFAAMGFNLRARRVGDGGLGGLGSDRRSAGSGPLGARRGTELAARCQAPATPELVGSAGPVPLTNREREIALLAADGLTTRVIAERLYLSARTVDNHLARIYTKLGITNRSELAATLRR